MQKRIYSLVAMWMTCLLAALPAMADTMSNAPGAGGFSPGGLNGNVQYNNAGAFGGYTDTQLTTHINAFTSTLSGAVPLSGGGTTNFLRADGTFAAPASGGGTFLPPGFIALSAMSSALDNVVSPAGDYIYVSGVLASNSHGAIEQIKVSDGSLVATVDLGAGVQPRNLAISPNGLALYGADEVTGTTWWKIATSGMTITHTSTLAVAIAENTAQQFDLSPDGATYAYVDDALDKVYKINTSTYAVTTVTVGNSDGGANGACGVAWYNGSSSNFYVAYKNNATIDLYSAGVYTSAIATGFTGHIFFEAMRSGINSSLFIVNTDETDGTTPGLIVVNSGTAYLISTNYSASFLSMNSASPTAIQNANDICLLTFDGGALYSIDNYFRQLLPIPLPLQLGDPNTPQGPRNAVFAPDDSSRVYAIGAVFTTSPELWSILANVINPPPGPQGNIQVSNGGGDWTSAAVGGDVALSWTTGSPNPTLTAKVRGTNGGALTGTTSLTAVTVNSQYTVSGTFTVTLPTATAGLEGLALTFINLANNPVTFTPTSGNINGATTYVNTIQYQANTFKIINGAWYAI